MQEAGIARRAGGRSPEHGRMAARLSRMLKRQIDALEAEPVEGFSETTVKALLLLAKALQSMQDAGRRDRETGTGRDNGADKVAASLAGLAGNTIGAAEQGQIADALVQAIGAGGALLAIYGRLAAKEVLLR